MHQPIFHFPSHSLLCALLPTTVLCSHFTFDRLMTDDALITSGGLLNGDLCIYGGDFEE